jgi:hypothetical protein
MTARLSATIARLLSGAVIGAMLWVAPGARAVAQQSNDGTYTKEEIVEKAQGFFGATTKGLAEGIEKIFEDLGRPNGFIVGEEFGGAFFVGLRYGRGALHQKSARPLPLFWQGPSIGFDFGGNASRAFTLVYHLKQPGDLFKRFPGVDGSIYVIAGLSLNYQQAGDTILVPIRTGVGLRAGASIGYLHYNREHSWLPF